MQYGALSKMSIKELLCLMTGITKKERMTCSEYRIWRKAEKIVSKKLDERLKKLGYEV